MDRQLEWRVAVGLPAAGGVHQQEERVLEAPEEIGIANLVERPHLTG
jgi:hypothetical protein